MTRMIPPLMGLLLSICGVLDAQEVAKPSLVGTWTAEDKQAKTEIVFRKDGTFTRKVSTAEGTQADRGKYQVVSNMIVVEAEGEPETIVVKFRFLAANKLQLIIPEEGSVTVQRAATGPPPETPPEKPIEPTPATQPAATRPVRKPRKYKPPDPLLTGDEPLWPLRVHFRYGYMDKAGALRITPQFDRATSFEEGLAAVQINEKCGCIDRTGKLVIALKFDAGHPFTEGLGGVAVDEKWGFIDKTGEFVVEPRFEKVGAFREGLSWVQLGGKTGFIDKSGKLVIEAKYAGGTRFSGGLAGVAAGGKWGFIDRTGKMIIEPQYDNAWSFSEGLALVQVEGGWAFIDRTGKQVIEADFAKVHSFREGLACVEEDDKSGFIDKTGKLVIPATLSWAHDFSEGLAAAGKDDEDGYIGKTGKFAFKVKAQLLYGFRDGLAVIAGPYFQETYVDKKGKVLYDALKDIRPWADLKRVSESFICGTEHWPIPVGSKEMAEQYLFQLRDSRNRPMYFKLIGEEPGGRYSDGQLRYEVVSQDGFAGTLRLALPYLGRADIRLEDMTSPPGMFFPRKKEK